MKRSTGLRAYVIGTGSLRAALNSVAITFYTGTIPASADAAISVDSSLLCMITVNGDGATGLTWEQDASSGALVKNSSEVWLGAIVNSGTATYFRVGSLTDTGESSTTLIRLQGTVGVADADLVTTTTFTQGDEFKVNNFVVSIPAG